MAKNKHKYSPQLYFNRNIQGSVQQSINKGLHNKKQIHDITNIEQFRGTSNPRKGTRKGTRKGKRKNVIIKKKEDNVINININKNIDKIHKEIKKQKINKEKDKEKEFKNELKRLRTNAKGIIKRAEESGKIDLFKEVYGQDLDVKKLINSQEDFDNLKDVSKKITSIIKKQKDIDNLKPIVYNEDNTKADIVKEKEKQKEKQNKQIEKIKDEILQERKQQKEDALKNSNSDSVALFRQDNPNDDVYVRVRDIHEQEELESILDGLREKNLTEKLREKTYNDVYNFLSKNYFNEILHSRERLKDGSPHELSVKERLELIAKSFGSDYAKAQDFLNELISTSFKGEYDSGEKKYNIVGFRAEMMNRLNRAEEKAFMLNNK